MPSGLFEGDLEPPQPPAPAARRRLTFSHVLHILLLAGLGVLIWQVVLLRRAVIESRPGSRIGAMEVEVVNIRPIKVDVDNSLPINVDVDNHELNVHVTNPELDVHVSNY